MNQQQNFWKDIYSAEYIKNNNQFDVALGVKGWSTMLKSIAIDDLKNGILECGCNIGRNLEFIRKVSPHLPISIIEISEEAYRYVLNKYHPLHHYNGSIEDSSFNGKKFDLVFTMGVLIHIHPDNLLSVMGKMYEFSNRYILIGEYFNRTPVMINYRGVDDRLFKRDFGKLFIENFDVNLVDYGFLWGHLYDEAGFDDITWWLFERK